MKEKIEWYREVLELEPNSKIFFPFAKLLAEDGQIDKAIDVLEKGLERHTEYLEARLFLIELLFSMRKKDACTRQINQLSAMFASYAGFWQAWAACLAEEPGERDTASILRFLAANFISGPIKLHDVINKGLKAILEEKQPSKPLSDWNDNKESDNDLAQSTEKIDFDSEDLSVLASPDRLNIEQEKNDSPEELFLKEDIMEDKEKSARDTSLKSLEKVYSVKNFSQEDEIKPTQGSPVKMNINNSDTLVEEEAKAIETGADSSATDFAEDISEITENETEDENVATNNQTDGTLNLESAKIHIPPVLEGNEKEIFLESHIPGEESTSVDVIANVEEIAESSMDKVHNGLELEKNTVRAETGAAESGIAEDIITSSTENNTLTMLEKEEAVEIDTEGINSNEVFDEAGIDINKVERSPASLSLEENVEDILKDALKGENIENLLKNEELDAIDIPDVPDLMVETDSSVQPVKETVDSKPETEEAAFDALIDTLADQSLELGSGYELQTNSLKESNFIKEDLIDPVDEEELDEIFNEDLENAVKVEKTNKPVKRKPLTQDIKEEKISLRTKSMAEVLASQGDIQGALDIYHELESTTQDAKEVAELRKKIKALESRNTGDLRPDEADKQDSKKLIGLLETLAKRVEARVAN